MSETSTPPEQQVRDTFFSLFNQNLPELYRFVRHELAARQAAGELQVDDPTPEDVVDEVLLRAYHEFVRRPAGREHVTWLQQLARERIQIEVRRRKAASEQDTHLEEDIPETLPAEEASSLGEEILFFYQPDEDLKLEDVVADEKARTPEQDAEKTELKRCLGEALANLPQLWRRALVLHHVRGLPYSQLARVLKLPEPEVRTLIEHTRAYLRQKLVDSGCVLKKNPTTSGSVP